MIMAAAGDRSIFWIFRPEAAGIVPSIVYLVILFCFLPFTLTTNLFYLQGSLSLLKEIKVQGRKHKFKNWAALPCSYIYSFACV